MFEFTDDCILGIEQIDEEHRHLFELLNKAYGLLVTNYHSDYYNEIKSIIDELGYYAEQHFEHEEDYMMQIRDPELIVQRVQHAAFCDTVHEFEFINIDREEQQQEVLVDLVNFLARWLYRHILGSDILIGKLPPLDEWLLKENPCEFTEEYLTGIDLIDREHEEIFRIVEQAHRLIRSTNELDFNRITEIMDKIKQYSKEHFDDEEDYMRDIKYEGLEAQKHSHSLFIDEFCSIDLSKMEGKPKENLDELLAFLLGWMINHIVTADKKIP